MIIRSKLEVPPPPARLAPRPRLDRLLAGLLDQHSVVWIGAAAGAGKTTALGQAIKDRRVAWLTLDGTETRPDRLLTYLAAALELAKPLGTADVPPAEAAGYLAAGLPGAPLVLVIDELERLASAPEALDVIRNLIRHAPPSLCVALASRRDLPLGLDDASWPPRLGRLDETALALTVDEAAQVLAAAGRPDLDAAATVAATGGWVTGVLFEAAEPGTLKRYLDQQIMAALTAAEQELLITTAVLEEVSAPAAENLGVAGAGEILAGLRSRYPPGEWRPDGTFRAYPRIRAYLRLLLDRRGSGDRRAVHRRHGELLAAAGAAEQATEAFLLTGSPDLAAATAEQVIADVIERLDLDLAARWLGGLGNDRVESSVPLAQAALLLAVTKEHFGSGADLSDRVLARRAGNAPAVPQRLASLMAWCYMITGRADDALRVLDAAEQGPETAIIRSVIDLDRPGGDYSQLAPPSGGPIDALLMRIQWYYGRLTPLVASSASRWVTAVNRPWEISALYGLGRLDEALTLYRQTETEGLGGHWLATSVYAELMAGLDRADEAWRALRRRRDLRETGSNRLRLLYLLVEAKIALQLDKDVGAARGALAEVDADPETHNAPYLLVQLSMWRGLAMLLDGQDKAARVVLRHAVQTMVSLDQILDLPAAAVYLSEAEWRAGEEAAADAAADTALDAARRQGSNFGLLRALSDFPEVAARRLDAEPTEESAWHELGQALRHARKRPGPAGAAEVSAHIGDLGRRSIIVAGAELTPPITKSIELLAYLTAREPPQATREELLAALFDGRGDDSTRAYLRLAVNRARETLPASAGLSSAAGLLRLTGGGVTSDSSRFLVLLKEAGSVGGAAGLEFTERALALYDGRILLPGVKSDWVARRRRELAEAATDARARAASLAFETGRYLLAQDLARQTLADDPYREGAWRTLMRVCAALGDNDGVLSEYRACRDALLELGTEPDPTTRALLQRLRR